MAQSANDAFDKQAKKDEESQGKTWEHEEGDAIWGALTRIDVVKTRFGLRGLINLKNTDKASGGVKKGETATIWLSAGLLYRFLDEMKGRPSLGTIVGIRYEGKVKQESGNTKKTYTVIFPMDEDDDEQIAFTQDHERWGAVDMRLNDDGSRGRSRERGSDSDEPEGGWF